jgi:hypothetical protein
MAGLERFGWFGSSLSPTSGKTLQTSLQNVLCTDNIGVANKTTVRALK